MQQEPDPIDLDAARAAREIAEREQKAKREIEISDFKWLMTDERGRRFVWRLMSEGRVFHNPAGADMFEIGRQVGEKSQGLKLLNELIALCPEKWLEMINDQKRR